MSKDPDGPGDNVSQDTQPEWTRHWIAFNEAMTKRLNDGFLEYGDESFSRSQESLDDEIEEEILDIIGWAYVKWVARRIKRGL